MTCSKKCLSKYQSQHRAGENNYNWRGGKCKELSGIDARFKQKFNIKREWLVERYHVDQLSTPEIAELLDCSSSTIERWMKKYNIPFRSLSEGKRLAWNRSGYKSRDSWGSNNSNWRGGKSFEPYPPTFNRRFKRMIRRRDASQCAVCRLRGRHVHHINYVKDDTMPENCITLCKACHGTTNGNREYWEQELSSLIAARLKHISTRRRLMRCWKSDDHS